MTTNEQQVWAKMLHALRNCEVVMRIEHSLNSDYGWAEFINDNLSAVIEEAEKIEKEMDNEP